MSRELVLKLKTDKNLKDEELLTLLKTDEVDQFLRQEADLVRRKIYGNKVYIRGLIEISNYCKNNCLYCGIRGENFGVTRYRLTKEEILSACEMGYALGFRTFVMQGGEDPYFTDDIICDIVKEIRKRFADCAITLSLGEKTKEAYEMFFKAGANRYLLRHEAADFNLYSKLHPKKMSLESRKKCLFDLKEIGYQVGSGFMVGAPFQTLENIICDLRFLQALNPDMIGIGPYISHSQTPFKEYKNGETKLTLRLISILRLMFPHSLIPATTALGTNSENGREQGIMAGANVVMPNLSPENVRSLYEIYENKLTVGAESAQELDKLKKCMKDIGYEVVVDIGNVKR
ncbi:MAG: [Clostridia bacterium]|nr:[FeFe] hydrogenase H-cluster radical SAM maturase HydE [Clostridia bacterium]